MPFDNEQAPIDGGDDALLDEAPSKSDSVQGTSDTSPESGNFSQFLLRHNRFNFFISPFLPAGPI